MRILKGSLPSHASHDGPLKNVSVALKDLFVTKDTVTTAGSKMLNDYVSPFDSTVVELLHQSGANIVGKTNMDEFGMGSYNTNSIHGPVINPYYLDTEQTKDSKWDLKSTDPPDFNQLDPSSVRVAGGSSGGSAAAVAAGLCDVAISSDTGGSTRLPASYCGVIGFKPSYGRISRRGMIAYASSLDTVGIMARKIGDVRKVFGVLDHYEANDPTSIQVRPAAHALDGPLIVGVPQEFFTSEVSDESLGSFRRAAHKFRKQGAVLKSVSLPSTPYSLAAYYTIATAEASSNLSRYDGARFGFRHEDSLDLLDMVRKTRSEGFSDEVKKRILLGTFTLSDGSFDNYFLKAQKIRLDIRNEFDALFRHENILTQTAPNAEGCHVLLHPTSTSIAPLLSETSASTGYTQDILNVPSSLAGLPSISIPTHGRAKNQLPVGVTLTAQWGEDSFLLDLAQSLLE